MKCEKCNQNIRPIFKDKSLGWKRDNIIWKHLLLPDGIGILLFILVLLMVIAYQHDVNECNKFQEDPCTYCANRNCDTCSKPLGHNNFVIGNLTTQNERLRNI